MTGMERGFGLLFVALAACGGAQSSAPAEAPRQSPGSAAPTPAAPAASSAAPAERDQPTIESQREPFMERCVSKAHAPDYCECAFGQFREVFKDADLSAELEQSDPRLQTLQEKTVAACGTKLGEEQVKASFLQACGGDDPKKQNYCTCAWPALRKQLSIVDFLGEGNSPRFVAAKKSMVVACKGKLPVEVTKKEFIAGCAENRPDREATCTCLWKKIKAKYSSEEIAADVADVKSVPGLDECQK
jgi:hypothetical protein